MFLYGSARRRCGFGLPRPAKRFRSWLGLALPICCAGCLVGPDFTSPSAPIAERWIESHDPSVDTRNQEYRDWWTVFHDPVLNRLIEIAYNQSLTLVSAGTRVLEARAQLGVAIGEFYPQVQQGNGSVTYIRPSHADTTEFPITVTRNFWRDSLGLTVNWELDFWGKFRRAIESADASYLASIANYDYVLATLLGDVATTYIGIRTLQNADPDSRREYRQAEEGAGDCRGEIPRWHRDQARRLPGRKRSRTNRVDNPPADHPAEPRFQRAGRAARHGATADGPAAEGVKRDPGSAKNRRGRHPRRSRPPQAGYSRRRAGGDGAERANRHRRGEPLSGIQSDRDLWHGSQQCRPRQAEASLRGERHHLRLRTGVSVEHSQLRGHHQSGPRRGCRAADASGQLSEYGAASAAAGRERADELSARDG